MHIRLYGLLYKRANHAAFSRRKNKSQKLTKVSSWMKSITSNYLLHPRRSTAEWRAIRLATEGARGSP